MYRLNPCWEYVDPVPEVCCNILCDGKNLDITFEVWESPDCFRVECTGDGDPCWQDSCVEVFVQSPRLGGYFNFETNSRGVTLAEFGAERNGRRRFSPEEYGHLRREILQEPTTQDDGRIHWAVRIGIGLELLNILSGEEIRGNLYKCASRAARPVYLAMYPVGTLTPDFHRPEFFGQLV